MRAGILLGAIAGSLVWAQDAPQGVPPQNDPANNAPSANAPAVSQPQSGEWRRLGAPDGVALSMPQNAPQAAQQGGAPPPPQGVQQGPPPVNGGPQNYPPQNYPQQGYPPQGYPQQAYQPPPLPAQLTLPAGSFITVRLNQVLSSDHNHEGDAFTASLVKPVVVDGVVIADRGQTLVGRVSQAEKAGRVKGTSKLGVELSDLTLIDGTPAPIKTSLINRSGPTSVGRDAAAIGGTTALGAAAGAVADLGRGAAIGAGPGAAVGTIGVLLTRGRPTLLYPEMVLTFRVENPVVVSTARAPQAFRFVGPGDYDQPQDRPRMQGRPGPYYGGAYAGYPYPYYPYPYYPYYYGPGFGIRLGGGYRYWR
jgi:hypothetical protein